MRYSHKTGGREDAANVFTNNSMGVKVFEMGLNIPTNFKQRVCYRASLALEKDKWVCISLSF